MVGGSHSFDADAAVWVVFRSWVWAKIRRQYRDAGGHAVRFAYLGTSDFILDWTPGVEHARAEGLGVLATTDEGAATRWLSPGEL